MQRAMGRVALAVQAGPRGTMLRDLEQAGNLRACFPRSRNGALEAVIVNTGGGIADGDLLHVEAQAGAGTRTTLTTPSAERVYRARPGAAPARVSTRLRLEAGAGLAFLPQETILFEGCTLDRTLDVSVHPDACFLAVEALVFGRAASGETLTHARLRDTIRIHRNDRLVLHDAVRLQGADLAARACAGGARGAATILYVAPDSAGYLEPVRAALAGVEAGASCWDGLLAVRMLAPDAASLRRHVVAALAILRQEPLPRVWSS